MKKADIVGKWMRGPNSKGQNVAWKVRMRVQSAWIKCFSFPSLLII